MRFRNRSSLSILSSKKALSFKAIWQIVLLLILISVTLIFYFVIQWFANITLDTGRAEAVTLMNRLYFSQDGFSYDDGIREYPGIIDISRFESSTLEKLVIIDDDSKLNAKLTLTDMNNKNIKEAYLNEEWFNRLEVLTAFEGKGSARKFSEKRYVLIKHPDKALLQPAFLNFEVIIPR